MKLFTLIRLFLLSVVTGHWQLLEARIDCSILQERIDSLINPPLLKQAGQILRFDRTLLDIGTLTEDDAPKTYRFMCTNLSGKTLNLTRVKTTCGCVVADIQSGDILPGGNKGYRIDLQSE